MGEVDGFQASRNATKPPSAHLTGYTSIKIWGRLHRFGNTLPPANRASAPGMHCFVGSRLIRDSTEIGTRRAADQGRVSFERGLSRVWVNGLRKGGVDSGLVGTLRVTVAPMM
jgi:hypothetical protein